LKQQAGKIALIGCGRIAGHHCRWIRKTSVVELVAVCDLIEEKAIAYGKEFAVPHFTNYRRMLEALPQIDTVAVVTPSGMHFEHAMEILDRYGKNIVVEKPTFMRPSEVLRAYELAKHKGLQIFPVFQNRNNLAVQRVKRALESGELGAVRVVAVRLRWCRPQRYYDLSPWRGTFSHDGGALTNQGVHHVDLVRYLGGEVLEVNATMATLGADIEVEDTVVGTMRCTSGGLGVLEVTTAARPDDFEASISLVCEKGLAQIGGIAVNELQVFTPDRSACAQYSEDFGGVVYGNGHGDMYRHIGETLNGGKPYPVDEKDCLGSIRLLNAYYRADEAGDWVDVVCDSESPRLGRPDEKLSALYRTPADA
jgi:predicted dehydrogenase